MLSGDCDGCCFCNFAFSSGRRPDAKEASVFELILVKYIER